MSQKDINLKILNDFFDIVSLDIPLPRLKKQRLTIAYHNKSGIYWIVRSKYTHGAQEILISFSKGNKRYIQDNPLRLKLMSESTLITMFVLKEEFIQKQNEVLRALGLSLRQPRRSGKFEVTESVMPKKSQDTWIDSYSKNQTHAPPQDVVFEIYDIALVNKSNPKGIAIAHWSRLKQRYVASVWDDSRSRFDTLELSTIMHWRHLSKTN